MMANRFKKLLGVVIVGVFAFTANAQTNWTGDGGRGKSIAIVAPRATGLPDSLNYLPVLVQGELVSNFTMFSAISVLDRQNYETQLLELMEEIYSDRARESLNLGNLPHTDYLMDGTITRTRTGYNLQVRVLRTSDQTTVATHSATTTFDELDNLTGVRRASLELLQRMGVTLTAQARTALGGAATSSHVSAQTALAQGIVAQRQGTEVAALSYFYQAASFDPSLAEALGRSQIMSANISSANIGENIRNDIVWRRDWVARLTQTEEAFYRMISTAPPPYKLFYSTGIETQNINYQTETADLSIPIRLTANYEWFRAMRQSLQAAQMVLDGLNSTNRKNEWGLSGWPWRTGVTNTNPFGDLGDQRQNVDRWKFDISAEFELVDERGRVIGRQTVLLNPSFSIHVEGCGYVNNFLNRVGVSRSDRISSSRWEQTCVSQRLSLATPKDTVWTLTFNGVRANDISDNLTIRIAKINGQSPETARFSVGAIPSSEWTSIRRGSFTDARDGRTYRTVIMPDGNEWMAENLNYNPGSRGNSWCYDNSSANCAIYGRLYDWNTAMAGSSGSFANPSGVQGICPAGWHLPSGAEMRMLLRNRGPKLKSSTGWNEDSNGTDDYGFSALPGGYYEGRIAPRLGAGEGFSDVGWRGYWWSATFVDEPQQTWYLFLSESTNTSYHSIRMGNVNNGYSVRCVRD